LLILRSATRKISSGITTLSLVDFSAFFLFITNIISTCTRVKVVKTRYSSVPWFSSEISEAIAVRDYWYGRKRSFPRNIFIETRFKRSRNFVTSLIRGHKKRYYVGLVHGCVGNGRCLWQVLNTRIFNKRQSTRESVRAVRDDLGNAIKSGFVMHLTIIFWALIVFCVTHLYFLEARDLSR
jgi:hypothetical protein